MRIYLDCKDYINLLERRQAGLGPDEFSRFLMQGGHTLIFSLPLICEMISPLWDPMSNTVITRTLNQMEQFPHEWIDLVRLANLEVTYATACRRAKKEYVHAEVNPFVPSFLRTIIRDPDKLDLYLKYPLAEIAFDLWRSGSFDPRIQNARHVDTYRRLMSQERDFLDKVNNKQQARRELFIKRVVERIEREKLYEASERGRTELFSEVGEYIFEDPTRCPALRLVFETFHSLVVDLGDKLSDGDLGDLAHLYALPYVDWYTTDRRIASHSRRVSEALRTEYHKRIRRSLEELIDTMWAG